MTLPMWFTKKVFVDGRIVRQQSWQSNVNFWHESEFQVKKLLVE